MFEIPYAKTSLESFQFLTINFFFGRGRKRTGMAVLTKSMGIEQLRLLHVIIFNCTIYIVKFSGQPVPS